MEDTMIVPHVFACSSYRPQRLKIRSVRVGHICIACMHSMLFVSLIRLSRLIGRKETIVYLSTPYSEKAAGGALFSRRLGSVTWCMQHVGVAVQPAVRPTLLRQMGMGSLTCAQIWVRGVHTNVGWAQTSAQELTRDIKLFLTLLRIMYMIVSPTLK